MLRSSVQQLSNVASVLAMFLFLTAGLAPQHANGQSVRDRFSVVAEHPFYDTRVDSFTAKQKNLFRHLIEAAKIMDTIYLDQVHPMNLKWVAELQKRSAAGNAEAGLLLKYFNISYGPWDVFNPDEWIFPPDLTSGLKTPILPGYNLYPTNEVDGVLQSVSTEELDAWIEAHPEDTKEFKSPFTVIRRGKDGKGFIAIPYSEYYKTQLSKAAKELEEAAKYADEKSVRELLTSRAQAFRTNQFRETEVAWIRTHDAEVQVLIGPYEESVDDIWGAKRGFGARIGLRDPEGTADLQTYKSLVSTFQENLPLEAKYRPDQPKTPFFTVWRQIFISGDSRRGAQTLGQKLTNDSEFTIRHGARQNFYRNSQDGKCEKILMPIAKTVLVDKLQPFVSCDSFFKATLHHEYGHALGPQFWYPDWDNPDPAARKEVNEQMPKWGGKLEELKADTLSFYSRQYMISKGLETAADPARDLEMEMYASMTAGFFRSVQFGMHRSYALNAMIMMNQLLDAKALFFDPKQGGRVNIDTARVAAVLRSNAADALMMQVRNDDATAKEYFDRWAVIRPETQKLLDRMNAAGIPRDLFPVFPALAKLGM